jgi:hypothetical protein
MTLTPAQKRAKQKYYQKNRQDIKLKMRAYWTKNKDLINKKRATKYEK